MLRLKTQRGASLVEVLVTLLIAVIGTLGMAQLQMVSIKNVNSSFYRHQATVLAYDLAERMRGNKKGALAGHYTLTALSTDASAPACTSCSAEDLAKRDLHEWGQLLAGLPGVGATVTRSAERYTIQLRWEEQTTNNSFGQRNADATQQQSLSITVQP